MVPTSFCGERLEQLSEHGINVVIYANQLMRAAVPAMQEAAESILRNHRSEEAEETLMPFGRIIRMIDELE